MTSTATPPPQRRLTVGEKLAQAERLWFAARAVRTAAERTRHPDWTDEQVQAAVRRAFLLAR